MPRPPSRREKTASPRATAPRTPTEFPGPPALAWLAALGVILLAAPPESNWVWSVNGLRSALPEARFALVLFALAAAALPWIGRRPRAMWTALALGLALAAAFPLREKLHFLGDSGLRDRAIVTWSGEILNHDLGTWARRLHTNPLDILVNLVLPGSLDRLGLGLTRSLSVTSLALALLYFAGVWRVCARLRVPEASRLAFCATFALAGSLEAFAGYSESVGVVFVAATWWWAEMLAPMDRPAQALRVSLAWLMVFMAHRLGVLMLVPLLWRSLGPPAEGDTHAARRALLAVTIGMIVVSGALLAAIVGAHQIGMDLRETLAAVRSEVRGPDAPLAGTLNAVWLVAPLLFIAPALAGGRALKDFVRSPEAGFMLASCAISIPFVWIQTTRAAGGGAHRDWDVTLILGFPLAFTAASLLARLPAARLRGAMAAALPVLALLAGSWLAVNADEEAATRRVLALSAKPPRLSDEQACAVEMFLGQRAMDLGNPALAAPRYERAFALISNARYAIQAAECWTLAADRNNAVRMLALAHTRPLTPELALAAQRVQEMIAARDSDDARAAPGVAPAPESH